MRQIKGSATRIPVYCRSTIKLFNNGTVGADITDQKTVALRGMFLYSFKLYFTCREINHFLLTKNFPKRLEITTTRLFLW